VITPDIIAQPTAVTPNRPLCLSSALPRASLQRRYLTANQLKFATEPVAPSLSITTRMICTPAVSVIPVLVMVWKVCQPPVFGKRAGRVHAVTSMWNVPPAPFDAARTSIA
jgi:hypothetical protein